MRFRFIFSIQDAILFVEKPTLLMFRAMMKFCGLPRSLKAPTLLDFYATIDKLEKSASKYSWGPFRFPQCFPYTVYPKKYAHGFVVLCFVVVMQSFIMNSHEVFIHIHQGCFAGTGAIVRLPQCQWSKPDGYGKISQCITTTKHSKAKTVCIFLGIYCIFEEKLFHILISYTITVYI